MFNIDLKCVMSKSDKMAYINFHTHTAVRVRIIYCRTYVQKKGTTNTQRNVVCTPYVIYIYVHTIYEFQSQNCM